MTTQTIDQLTTAIESAKQLDANCDTVRRNQVLLQIYDISGLTVAAADKAITDAGFGFIVPAARRK